jgi:hypothetical protein
MDVEMFLIECEEYDWDPVEIFGKNYSIAGSDGDRSALIGMLWCLLRRFDHAVFPLIEALGDKRYASDAAFAIAATEDPSLAPLVLERGKRFRNARRKKMISDLATSLQSRDLRLFTVALGLAKKVEDVPGPWWPQEPRWWPSWWPRYPEARREDIGRPPGMM